MPKEPNLIEKKENGGIRQLEALAPFKVVQRILAFSATFLWIFVAVNVTAALWVEAITNIVIADKMVEFALSSYVWVLYPLHMVCISAVES